MLVIIIFQGVVQATQVFLVNAAWRSLPSGNQHLVWDSIPANLVVKLQDHEPKTCHRMIKRDVSLELTKRNASMLLLHPLLLHLLLLLTMFHRLLKFQVPPVQMALPPQSQLNHKRGDPMDLGRSGKIQGQDLR